jgi:hypothetical protein
MAMPVVAVLLAVHVAPVLSHAKLITAVALVEYAASVVFGVFACSSAWARSRRQDQQLE